MSPRLILSLLALCLTALLAPAQTADAPDEGPVLLGNIENGSYISPNGLFRIPIPVLPELGGRITDTVNMVTFQDAFTTHITLAAIPMDSLMLEALAKSNRKEYLIKFFTGIMVPGMQKRFKDMTLEANGVFMPKIHDGAVLINTLIPGGTAFYSRIAMFGATDNLPVAKRGNLLFIHGDVLFIISTELGERSTARSAYKKTLEQENDILRKQLLALHASLVIKGAEASPSAPASKDASAIVVPGVK
jgi:hypothetical protein